MEKWKARMDSSGKQSWRLEAIKKNIWSDHFVVKTNKKKGSLRIEKGLIRDLLVAIESRGFSEMGKPHQPENKREL